MRCLRCLADIDHKPQVIVFKSPIAGILPTTTDRRMCLDCGGNGSNQLSQDKFDSLVRKFEDLTQEVALVETATPESSLPAVAYVETMDHAVAKVENAMGRCERWVGTHPCKYQQAFWVQRGPIGMLVCNRHLGPTVKELATKSAGRYGMSEHYEGYWISTLHKVVVKVPNGTGGWIA